MRRGAGQPRRASGQRRASPLTFKEISLFAFSLLFVFFLVPGAALGAVPPVPPRPAKYVTDNAGVLRADAAARLNEKLAAFERETSNQVIVWVDRKVPEGTTLEEFANRCVREWGVGQKGTSNGIAFFLFTEDRKMRMEVGYGLEGALPDARAHRIDAEIVAPFLRAGDVPGALDAAADAIFAAARGEPYRGTGTTAAERGRGSGKRTLVRVVLLSAFALAFGFLIVATWRSFRRRRAPGSRAAASSTEPAASGWSSDSASSSSSSDSSSSSSDFSGGGGDSGGGGSSDSY